MTFATAVPISFTSFVYRTNVYWSVIHGIKRKPHLSVVWNWYHFVAIAILHQPSPTDSADINTRLQLSDTSSIPPMHGGFLLIPAVVINSPNWYAMYIYIHIYLSFWNKAAHEGLGMVINHAGQPVLTRDALFYKKGTMASLQFERLVIVWQEWYIVLCFLFPDMDNFCNFIIIYLIYLPKIYPEIYG